MIKSGEMSLGTKFLFFKTIPGFRSLVIRVVISLRSFLCRCWFYSIRKWKSKLLVSIVPLKMFPFCKKAEEYFRYSNQVRFRLQANLTDVF